MFKNAEKIPSSEHYIVQEYIDKPLLLEGFKFDLRIYVLITSCDPLRIFLFSDGLVRLATEKYLPPQENNLVSLNLICKGLILVLEKFVKNYIKKNKLSLFGKK